MFIQIAIIDANAGADAFKITYLIIFSLLLALTDKMPPPCCKQ